MLLEAESRTSLQSGPCPFLVSTQNCRLAAFPVKRKSPGFAARKRDDDSDNDTRPKSTTPDFPKPVHPQITAKMTLPNVSQDLVWEIVRMCFVVDPPWNGGEWASKPAEPEKARAKPSNECKYRQQQLLPGQAQAGRWCPVLPRSSEPGQQERPQGTNPSSRQTSKERGAVYLGHRANRRSMMERC